MMNQISQTLVASQRGKNYITAEFRNHAHHS
jgi:hypothetical protein